MEIRFQTSIKDYEKYYLQAAGDLAWDTCRLKILRVSKIVFPLLLILIGFTNMIRRFFYYNQDKLDIRSFLYVFIAAAALFSLYVIVEKGIPLLKRWIVRKHIRKMIYSEKDPKSCLQEKPKGVIVNISEDRLRETLGKTVVEYTEPFIKDLVETNDYLAYTGADKKGHVIPKRVLKTDEEQANFKEMISKFTLEES